MRLLGSLAWPLLLLFLFLSLREQITAVFSAIPKKFSESTKVAIGSLSFEIAQTAKQTGDWQLPKLIQDLSANALTILLETGNSPHYFGWAEVGGTDYYFPDKDTLGALKELEEKRMLVFEMPMDKYIKSVGNLGLDTNLKESVQELIQAQPQIWYDAHRKLTDADVKTLQGQRYNLTATGKKAFRLLVDAVTKNLK